MCSSSGWKISRARGERRPCGLIARERHRKAFETAAQALERVLTNPEAPTELLAEDLRVAMFSLQRLTGAVDVEDILARFFRDSVSASEPAHQTVSRETFLDLF